MNKLYLVVKTGPKGELVRTTGEQTVFCFCGIIIDVMTLDGEAKSEVLTIQGGYWMLSTVSLGW